jgi:hypothetical protein
MSKIEMQLPVDVWVYVASYVTIQTLPSIVFTSKSIQDLVLTYLINNLENGNAVIKNITKRSTVASLPMKNMLKLILRYASTKNITKDLCLDAGIVHWAAHNGHIDIVQILVEQMPQHHENLLTEAAYAGHTELVKFLLADTRDLSAYTNGALLGAINQGHTDIVKLLLADKRLDPTYEYDTALVFAERNVEMMKLLLDDSRLTPTSELLGSAIQSDDLEMVKFLLSDKRIDPSTNDSYCLKIAKRSKWLNYYEEILNLLLDDKRVDHTAMDRPIPDDE